jgi:hypothetical protein
MRLFSLLLLLAAPAYAGNLLINGGFEQPSVVDTGLHYEHRSGTELTGWTSFSTYQGTVQFDSAYAPVSEGSQAVQLEISGDSISQSFATIAGQSYVLSFDLSSNSASSESTLGLAVASLIETFGGPPRGSYAHNTRQFTAASSTTTLVFTNAATVLTFPHLDNVAVIAVPEPAAAGLLIAGLVFLGWRVYCGSRAARAPC